MISLRPALPDEASYLTELCLRSKAVWGYGEDFINACLTELTINHETIASSHVIVAEKDGERIGFAQLEVHDGVAKLDKLYVEPGRLRTGAGRRLFDWARSQSSQLGATVLMIDADPNAVDFYRRMGAIDDGVTPSGSIPGRFIPRLKAYLPSSVPCPTSRSLFSSHGNNRHPCGN